MSFLICKVGLQRLFQVMLGFFGIFCLTPNVEATDFYEQRPVQIEPLKDQLARSPVFMHPGQITDYMSPYFGNAVYNYTSGWFLCDVDKYGSIKLTEIPDNPYVDLLGNLKKLPPPSQRLVMHLGTGMLATEDLQYLGGRVVLEWKGKGDVRLAIPLNGKTYAKFIPKSQGQPPGHYTNFPKSSSDSSTGQVHNGIRVYDMSDAPDGIDVVIYSMDPNNKVRDIRVWLNNGKKEPQNQKTLRPEGNDPFVEHKTVFHPKFLELANMYKGQPAIRMMSFANTVGNPQMNWVDARNPRAVFQNGYISTRDGFDPALFHGAGGVNSGQVVWTGPSYSHQVAFANATNKDLWINVPHFATPAYIRQMVRAIFFGCSQNGAPHTFPQPTTPAFPPPEFSFEGVG